ETERRSHEQQRAVSQGTSELEAKLAHVEALARERADDTTTRGSGAVCCLYFARIMRQVWRLTRGPQGSGEGVVAENGGLGSTESDGARFVDVHRKFAQQVVVRS